LLLDTTRREREELKLLRASGRIGDSIHRTLEHELDLSESRLTHPRIEAMRSRMRNGLLHLPSNGQTMEKCPLVPETVFRDKCPQTWKPALACYRHLRITARWIGLVSTSLAVIMLLRSTLYLPSLGLNNSSKYRRY
jgi:hypothetical protein